MDSHSKELFLETAVKIGKRICKQAIWQGNKCTWEITAPDKVNPKLRIGKKEIAGGTVYQGTAGIAIFLSELFRLTNEKLFKKTGRGAIEYALGEVQNLPSNSFGFHSGRVGITYSTILFSSYSNDEVLQKRGLQLLEPLKGQENNDYGLDVIGGAGGAIPALLKIYEITKDQISLELAINLGESLISKANMEPHGWSWGALKSSSVRGLCGYAHGASGIGHAFLELYNLTSSDYYLYAAEQAFLYERQFYNSEVNNWPDFRYTELSEFTSYNKIDELKEAIKNNTLPPYQIHYMSAWCHGAPGIGLARLRAFKLTGNEVYASESRDAISATIKSLNLSNGNYSLCHGFYGNAETLLNASRVFHDSNLSVIVENKIVQGIELFEKNNLPWPCGTMGSVTDPSLMLGEAGIGHFILREIDESVPSVLCITSNTKYQVEKNYQSIQKQYLTKYFSSTLSLIDKSEKKENFLIEKIDLEVGGKISDVEKVAALVEKYIPDKNNSFDEIIKDYFSLEKEKYNLALAITDYSKEFLDSLLRQSNGHIEWLLDKFQLSKSCRILNIKTDLTNVALIQASGMHLADNESFLVLFASANQVKVKRVNQFTFVLLGFLHEPVLLSEIISAFTQTFDVEKNAFETLQTKMKEQLIEAYKAGIINVI